MRPDLDCKENEAADPNQNGEMFPPVLAALHSPGENQQQLTLKRQGQQAEFFMLYLLKIPFVQRSPLFFSCG